MHIEIVSHAAPIPSVKEFGLFKSKEMEVKVPSAVLSKDVKQGDELVLFTEPKKASDKKRTLIIAHKPVTAKSSKVSK